MATMKCCHLAMTKMAILQDASEAILNPRLLAERMVNFY